MTLMICVILLMGGLIQVAFSGATPMNIVIVAISAILSVISIPALKKISPLKGRTSAMAYLIGIGILIAVSFILKPSGISEVSDKTNEAAASIKAGHLDNAEKLLEEAYKIDPSNGALNINFAALYISQGDAEKAKTYLDAASRRMYHDEMLYFNYGMYYYQLKDFPNARASFEKAVSINPDFAAASIYAGMMSYEMRDLKRAIYHLETARYIMPDNPNVLYLLAKANKDMMNYDDADKLLSLALEAVGKNNDIKVSIDKEIADVKKFKEGVLK